MRDFKFVHISDTHFCCESSSDFVKSMNTNYKTNEKLEYILKNITPIDFILLTGDLVHEGNEKDYENYREIFQKHCPDIPIFACLGNHDKPVPFGEGFLKKKLENKPYCQCDYFEDLRIISLDSAFHFGMEGVICKEQTLWLKEMLKTNYGRGTLILTHHPLIWEIKEAQCQYNDDFLEIIKNSDVIGFFNGHTHMSTDGFFQNIRHITGESMCFGTEVQEGKIIYTEKMGYNLCKMSGTLITVCERKVSPNYTILKSKSI